MQEPFPGTPSLLAGALGEQSALDITDSTQAPSPFRFGGSWARDGHEDPFAPRGAQGMRPEENTHAPVANALATTTEGLQTHSGWNAEDVRMGKRRRMSSPPTFTPSPTHPTEQPTRETVDTRDPLGMRPGASDLAPPPYLRMTAPLPAIEQNVSHVRTQSGWTNRDEELERTMRMAGPTGERHEPNVSGQVTMPRKLAGELLNTTIPGVGDITLPANVFEALIQQARESTLMRGPFQGAVYAQQPQQPVMSRTSRVLDARGATTAWSPHLDTTPDINMDIDQGGPNPAQPEYEMQSAPMLEDPMAQPHGPSGYGRPDDRGSALGARATSVRPPPAMMTQAYGQPPTPLTTMTPTPTNLAYQQQVLAMRFAGVPRSPHPTAALSPATIETPRTMMQIPTLPGALPLPPLRRDARLALSERAWPVTGSGESTLGMAARASAIPRMPTYVDRLVGLGRANCMPTPVDGFPMPQGRGFGDATRYDSDARRAIWMGIPEGQRCVIDVVAKHKFTVHEATRMTTELRKAIALVTGETASFFVLPPESIASADQWVDGPPGWLPVGLSERSVGILVEHKIFAFRELAFIVLDGANPQLPEHLFSLEGVTQDVDYVYVEVVQSCLWTQAADHIRAVVEGQPQYSSDPDLYAKHLLETITAEIEKPDEDAIVVHISMMPPTKDEAKWLDWRKGVQKCKFGSGYGPDAKVRNLQRCMACLATNHCLGNCPLVKVDGWTGPSRATIEANYPSASARGAAATNANVPHGGEGRTQIGGLNGGGWIAPQTRGAGPSNVGYGGTRGGYGGYNATTAHGPARGGASTRPPKNGGRFQQRF